MIIEKCSECGEELAGARLEEALFIPSLERLFCRGCAVSTKVVYHCEVIAAESIHPRDGGGACGWCGKYFKDELEGTLAFFIITNNSPDMLVCYRCMSAELCRRWLELNR